MKITANVAYNADKIVNKNYKNPTSKNSVENNDNSPEKSENGFVSKLIEEILGDNSDKIKSNNDAKSNGFGNEIEDLFSQIMNSGTMARSKFYMNVNYKRLLKDEEEFRNIILELKRFTMHDKDAGEYALNLFKGLVREFEKTSNSPEEVVSRVIDGLKGFIASFKPGEKGIAASAKDILKSALITSGDSLDKVGNFAKSSLVFDNDKEAQDFFDTICVKAERSKKYNYLKSTRKYVKDHKKDEEFNKKMEEISDLKYNGSADIIGSEVENLIKDIKKSSGDYDIIEVNNHVTDFDRLNADIYSPAFA